MIEVLAALVLNEMPRLLVEDDHVDIFVAKGGKLDGLLEDAPFALDESVVTGHVVRNSFNLYLFLAHI